MGASLHQAKDVLQGQTSPVFPSTRYQGSKAKLVNWIWDQLSGIDFNTCLDAFGGTGAVAYRLKQMGKRVTYNDALLFNSLIGKGLIENPAAQLDEAEIDRLLARHSDVDYPRFVQDTFKDIYYTDDENAWIDQTITNIHALSAGEGFDSGWSYKQALAFFALCQACIVKRPYNLFHRRNLYLRFAPVKRSFGNKVSWDRPFEAWFRHFAAEANRAVFDNGQVNRALNGNAVACPGAYDLVYIDPPYLPARGQGVDYHGFYHFLEGLAHYGSWESEVDMASKHRRLRPQPSPWTDRRRIYHSFDALFSRFHDSILVVSYRSDGAPTEDELAALMQRYKRAVRVAHYGQYKYALSTNTRSSELLLIGV